MLMPVAGGDMLIDDRPCTCQGNNPDCFRCNGTGMIPRKVANREEHSEAALLPNFLNAKDRSALSARAKEGLIKDQYKYAPVRKKNTPKTPAIKTIMVSCIKCKKGFISVDALISHESTHLMVTCHICNAAISQNKIQRHMNKAHKPSKMHKVHPRITQQKVKEDPLTRCPHCNLLILETRFAEHLSRAHGSNSVQRRLIKSINKSSATVKPGSSIPSQNSRASKQLDATYGQHVFRERGRFGSAASHDNYDDESNP